MGFEWDDDKNKANQAKHKISFEEAQAIFSDPRAYEFDAKTEEPRTLIIGMISGKLWAVVYTTRGENKRIISCRRARDSEREDYEKG